MKWAEKKCRKLKMGAVAYSTATNGLLKRIAFWEIAIRRCKDIPTPVRLWRRKKKAAKVTYNTSIHTDEELVVKLKEAHEDYKQAKKEHLEHRVTFLESLPSKDRDRLLHMEHQRSMG